MNEKQLVELLKKVPEGGNLIEVREYAEFGIVALIVEYGIQGTKHFEFSLNPGPDLTPSDEERPGPFPEKEGELVFIPGVKFGPLAGAEALIGEAAPKKRAAAKKPRGKKE